MADEIAIKVEDVGKIFRLPHEKNVSIKSAVINFYSRKRTFEKQQVLKDVSFEVKKGEFFGIVGRNGSGKSTLLKMLAGIYSPSKGGIQINGKLTPFIELGVGFNPELTGRENVYLNGALLGFNRKEMATLYDEIVEFAELDRFMDQKLKNYSSGMQVRLAFSIAIRARSEILLLDEVLAVGDAIFQKKCYDYFKQLKKDKRTVVFVSHDSSALLEYCNKGILLEKGQVLHRGTIEMIVNEYSDLLNEHEEQTPTTSKSGNKKRWGTGEAKVIGAKVMGTISGKEKMIFNDEDQEIVVRVLYKANKAVPAPAFGITVLDAEGQRVFTSNTMWSKVSTKNLSPGGETEVIWSIPNAFNTGTFSISPAISDPSGTKILDWLEDATMFKVRKKVKSLSYINVEHRIEIL
jgi:ABC-2 type transport system ATP-binding protein